MMQSAAAIRKEIRIVNTVSTAELGQRVDIASFNKYGHLSSDLALYRCGYVKDGAMAGRVTVFANGKMISVGTRGAGDSFRELRRAKGILRGHGLINPCTLAPRVRNMVGTTDFAKSLDIERLARSMPRSMYEPEQFPGLVHRIRGSTVALVFASGKVVIVGSKSYEELNQAYFHLNQHFSGAGG